MRLPICLLMVFFVANLAIAHSGASGVVKERMDAMTSMAKAMRSVSKLMAESSPQDFEVMGAAAKVIADHSGDAMTDLFPLGTGGHPSEARQNIWIENEEFSRLAHRLERVSLWLEMAVIAKSDGFTEAGESPSLQAILNDNLTPTLQIAEQLDIKDLVGEIGQTCKACHRKFRL